MSGKGKYKPERMKQKRAAFRAAGLCSCGRPPAAGKRRCDACIDAGRRSEKKHQEKRSAKRAEWRNANREHWRYLERKNRYKCRYGISMVEKDRMFADQGGLCAICREAPPSNRAWLYLDHDHATGKIRGLLCQRCNTGIGQFRDNETLLLAAVEYLRRHGLRVAS